MSELRRDPVAGRWVIVDTQHPRTPDSFDKEDHRIVQEATCQFCYHREPQTPPEIEVIRPSDTPPNSPGWSVRVISNKFPALRIEGNIDRHSVGLFDVSNGIGAHEIVVETPEHRLINLADFSVDQIKHVLEKYVSRSLSLAQDTRFKYIMLFKNYGKSAGATLEHAHSQIIALPMVPKTVVEELHGARHYHDDCGRCVFCDILVQESKDRARIVTENEDFVCFCPFAGRYAFECWLMPKAHHADIGSLTAKPDSLAKIFKEVLTRIKICLSDPAYNFYFHVSPVNYGYPESFHWHIEIVPQLTRVAGFEWGTGLYVVPTAPDVAAKYLREVGAGHTLVQK